MGVLQALEATKVLTSSDKDKPTSMLVFSAYSSQQFRNVVFRRRKRKCWACGVSPEITLPMFEAGSLDYATMCGVLNPVNLLSPEERVSPEEYKGLRVRPHVLIDTREKAQFELCHLDGGINVPIDDFRASINEGSSGDDASWVRGLKAEVPVYLVCRLGNDSQEAVKLLKDRFKAGNSPVSIMDIKGGLRGWREKVDPEFPDY